MSEFQPSGSGDSVRQITLRDSSRQAEGDKGELGRFGATVLGILRATDPSGLPEAGGVVQGLPQPRNWHLGVIDEPALPEAPDVLDARVSVALISDHAHPFRDPFLTEPVTTPAQAPGAKGGVGAAGGSLPPSRGAPQGGGVDTFLSPPQPGSLPVGIFEEVAAALAQAKALGALAAAKGPAPVAAAKGKLRPDPSNPFRNDWDARNRSTRIVDGRSPKGRTGLLSQLVRVIDEPSGGYVAGLVLGPDTTAEDPSSDAVAAGLLVDESGHDAQGGYLASVFEATNPADVTGFGPEGTPSGILGIRHDSHFEYEADTHGRILFDPSDVSSYKSPNWPLKLKSTLGFDPSRANEDTDNRHESGQWRPHYQALFFVEESPTDGAITTAPGEDHEGIDCDDGGCHGILLAIPLACDTPSEENLIDECFGYIALHEEGGRVVLKTGKGGGSWGFALPENTVTSAGGVVVDGNGALSHPPGFIEGG